MSERPDQGLMIVSGTWTLGFHGMSFRIRALAPSDVTDEYVAWLDSEDNRRLLEEAESAPNVDLETQIRYVQDIADSSHRILLGLFDDQSRLIGTSGSQNLGVEGKRPSLGLLIGNRSYRGMGLGAVLVWAATRILFREYDEEKVTARTIEVNQPALRSFLKAGYQIEGRLRREGYRRFCGWTDTIHLGCFQQELAPESEVGVDWMRHEGAG